MYHHVGHAERACKMKWASLGDLTPARTILIGTACSRDTNQAEIQDSRFRYDGTFDNSQRVLRRVSRADVLLFCACSTDRLG